MQKISNKGHIMNAITTKREKKSKEYSINQKLLKGIHYDNDHYSFVNSDRTMESALREGEFMSVSDAQSLGLITPEKADELQKFGIQEFTLLYVSFRVTEQMNDYIADAKNIMNMLPESIKDADALTQTILDNLQPGVVPIFMGHSMAGC
jgi:hypothetical protein